MMSHLEVKRQTMYEVPKHSGISGILNKLDRSVCKTFIEMLSVDALSPAKKPAKQFAIAAVVIDPKDESKFFAVKRPPNAKTLPDVWGLPTVAIKYDEQIEAAIERLAREKLNTQVEFLGCLGLDTMDRGEYELILMDVVVKLVGKEPSVWEAPTKQTKYVQQQWTNNLSIFEKAALKGSVCSRILLRSFNISF